MSCPQCGAVSARGALVCAACGASLQPPPAPAPPAPPRRRPTGVTLIAAADFIAAGVILLGAFAALMFFTMMGGLFGILFGGGVMAAFAGIGTFLVLAALAIAAGLVLLGLGLLRGSDAARILHRPAPSPGARRRARSCPDP